MSEGLKLCPFCGGNARLNEDGRIEAFMVSCVNCGGSSPYAETEEAAIAAWNRRTDCAQEEIGRLAGYLLSLDNGYPVVTEQFPNGMSAVDAAIATIEQLRYEEQLKKDTAKFRV